MKEDLREHLKELVVRYSKKKISAQQLTDDVLLIEELGFDSVGLVELVVEIEKQYQVTFWMKTCWRIRWEGLERWPRAWKS